MEKAQQLNVLHLNEVIVLQQLIGALSSPSFCHFGYSSFFVQPSHSSISLGDTLWLTVGFHTPLPSRQEVSYAINGHPLEDATHTLRPLKAGIGDYEVTATLHVPWSSKAQTVKNCSQYRVLAQ